MLEPIDVNADWSAFDADTAASDVEKIGSAVDRAKVLDEAASQVVGIPLCLHAHKIIVRDDAQELCTAWKSSKNLRSRPGNVMKVPDRVCDADSPQLAREGDKVIVVNPDEIVRTAEMCAQDGFHEGFALRGTARSLGGKRDAVT